MNDLPIEPSQVENQVENVAVPPILPQLQSKKKVWLLIGSVIIITLIALVIYFILPKPSQLSENNRPESNDPSNNLLNSPIGSYEELAVTVNPSVTAYSVDQELSNVINANDFAFSDQAKQLLVKNSFVVVPGYDDEFFPLYENNRYSYKPSFITTDSMLHNYHLMFDFLLKQLEEQQITAELKQLNTKMLAQSLQQYEQLKGTEWENAAKRNVGFFAVGSKLLDSAITVPTIVSNEVERELALISAHQGISASPVMNIGAVTTTKIDTPQGIQTVEALNEDYSQYIPLGHYDKTAQMQSYFKSMMWYGRLTFRMKNEDEIKSALLITLALNADNNQDTWNKIYEPINFFVGKSDDITYYQFKDLADRVYGKSATPELVSKDKAKFASFINEAKVLAPPQINSMPIFEASIQDDREQEIKGFRFMGQRFTIDAVIFQRLVYREVGDKTQSCQTFDPTKTSCTTGARCLPQGLDIPAALGSNEAKNILNEMGETEYACYSENISKMNTYLSGLDQEVWTQNLYWSWLYQLLPLLEEKKSGYPTFMQNTAWMRKELNTFLGSWSQLKHDTILYAKQVYAEMGGGLPDETDDRGYVEPNPFVYARLASLLQMTTSLLNERGLLTPNMQDNLSKMEKLAISLKTISEKELQNETLTDEEYELIRSYGGQLEHFWLEVNKDEPAFIETASQRDYLNENPAAIIADVATDPNGTVVEVGTGKINTIYVIAPVDGQLKITKGGVYSYYEFPWPMSDRLTDKKWREMLNSEQAPTSPAWTSEFIAK